VTVAVASYYDDTAADMAAVPTAESNSELTTPTASICQLVRGQNRCTTRRQLLAVAVIRLVSKLFPKFKVTSQ
jgi:hypothetical protein